MNSHEEKGIMKNLILSLACMGVLVGISSAAKGGNFGLGIILGDPSGISAKIATSPINSVNLVLGYNQYRDYGWRNNKNCCYDGGQLYVGGDYVWYNYNLIHVSKGKLPLYYGPGLNATISNYSSFGVRFVLGLEYQFADAPFDLFLEIGPGINVLPNTWANGSGGLGARFFF